MVTEQDFYFIMKIEYFDYINNIISYMLAF